MMDRLTSWPEYGHWARDARQFRFRQNAMGRLCY